MRLVRRACVRRGLSLGAEECDLAGRAAWCAGEKPTERLKLYSSLAPHSCLVSRRMSPRNQ